MARTARIHLHYVPVEGATDLYAVEVRQGRTARTIGRVSGGRRSRWIGLPIGGQTWSPSVATRRKATAPLLAAQRLQLAGARRTLVDVAEPGDIVEYRGSIEPMHGRYVVAAEREYDGRYVLLYQGDGNVALCQVRRESFVLTGEHLEMCPCGHPVPYAHLTEPTIDGGTCVARGCYCSHTDAERAALVATAGEPCRTRPPAAVPGRPRQRGARAFPPRPPRQPRRASLPPRQG